MLFSTQSSAAPAVLALVVWGVPVGAADRPPTPANRLARETSPYLLLHAHNPVDWYPWGAEAFARAKKENKLVFLSIGYSSCYWCHVMERESFANPAVAKLMNDWFICIKVDREERPDVDAVYMAALHAQGQRGGWPLSMFLTAEGKPIVGGTYWPADDKVIEGETQRGFKTILKIVHDFQTDKSDSLRQQADKLAAATTDALNRAQRGVALVELNRSLVNDAVEEIKGEFDPDYGGFGSRDRGFKGTKFPTPPYLDLLLYEAVRAGSGDLGNALGVTLDHMAQGGIYDQLGGGFHRYSTERTWLVPHFEKMLYDNAQLVEVYSAAYRLTKKPLYRRVVRETLAFVQRELTHPEGGFFSALDAETGHEEGRYYVWTDKEIDSALPNRDEAALIRQVYGVGDKPNFEGKYQILHLPKPLGEVARDLKLTEEGLEARLEPLRQKLFDARGQRPRPLLDTKVLTAWNGEMIAGFAVAGAALDEPRFTATAVRAADFVLRNLKTKDGRLQRTYGARPGAAAEARLNGYLDDYAFLVHGLLALHDATHEPRWLDEAKALTDTMVRLYGDGERGGFFYTSNDHEKLFVRSKDQYDGAQPSGNSVAARNLVRLWVKTKDEKYRELAERSLRAFAGPLKINPSGLTTMAHALALLLDAKGGTPADEKQPVQQGAKGRSSDKFVKVSAVAKPDKPGADGLQVVIVTLAIDKEWHLGANPPGETGVATTLTVAAKEKPEVKIDYPPGKAIKDPTVGEYRVYEGTVAIRATIRRARGDNSPLELSVKFAACSDKDMTCLPPVTVKLALP